jgi:6-phosphogluconate dehydrogenase
LYQLITRTDAIAELLIPLLDRFGPNEPLNLLKSVPEVAKELSKTYQPLKKVYSLAIESDAVAPAIGATLEWLKCVGGRDLPTDFEELELDCESGVASAAHCNKRLTCRDDLLMDV